MRTFVLYSVFAVLSILANVLVQEAALHILRIPHSLLLAMALGTLAGLALKYSLDKIWIFRYKHSNVAHNLKTFAAYTVMGLATTAIFWTTELMANAISHETLVRDTGAVIGLIVGYCVKYRLDKRFVFVPHA